MTPKVRLRWRKRVEEKAEDDLIDSVRLDTNVTEEESVSNRQTIQPISLPSLRAPLGLDVSKKKSTKTKIAAKRSTIDRKLQSRRKGRNRNRR